MDQVIDKNVQRKQKVRLVAKSAVICLILIGVVSGIRSIFTPSVDREMIRTSIVEIGEVKGAISTSGLFAPKNEKVIPGPYQTQIQKVLIKPGTRVSAGDVIMTLQNNHIQLKIKNLKDKLRLNQVEVKEQNQLLAKTEAQLSSLVEIKNIDLSILESKLARYRRLFETNTISEFDLKDAELAVKKLKIEIEQLNRQKSDAQDNRTVTLERLALQQQILSQELNEQERLIALSSVTAPMDGLVTSVLDKPGQSVNFGTQLATVANTQDFIIKGSVSDYYVSEVKDGMRVSFELHGRSQKGHISRILPSVKEGVLEFEVALAHQEHKDIAPNLRVPLSLITHEKGNALRIRKGQSAANSGRQDLFVIDSSTGLKQSVTLGVSDSTYIEVVAGLSLGQEVIISDTTQFQHLTSITIK